MFITSALCLAVLMLAAEKHSSTPFAPVRRSPAPRRTSSGPPAGMANCPTPGKIDRRGPDALCVSSVSGPIRNSWHKDHVFISDATNSCRFAVPYTGAAMNTARAFGPAAVSGFPHDSHWIVSPAPRDPLFSFFFFFHRTCFLLLLGERN